MFYKIIVFAQTLLGQYFYYMWKWIVHKVTGRCELLRIQYEEQPGFFRTTKTECSLKRSKVPECRQALQRVPDLSELVTKIMKLKTIHHDKHTVFRPRFTECVEKVHGYNALMGEIEELRLQKYDEDKHLSQLMELWKTLKPDEPLEKRFTRQWGDIGFQGEDPATDFRGMGLLGLYNLIFFSQKYTELARQLLSHSNHPKYGYFFAIVGINITELCNRYMTQGILKGHFYNLTSQSPSLDDFHRVYCYVFVEFDKLWMREKPDIMRFNEMRDRLEVQLQRQLRQPSVLLSLDDDSPQLLFKET